MKNLISYFEILMYFSFILVKVLIGAPRLWMFLINKNLRIVMSNFYYVK